MREATGDVPANVGFLTPRRAFWVCAALLVLFGAMSWIAACTKCPTYDETVHAPAGYVYWKYFDFRANPEHPPLFKYWASLPWLLWRPADDQVASPQWAGIPDDLTNQWAWAKRVMYHTPANDTAGLVARSRFMMMLVGVACGGMLAWFAYRLAGPAAAVITSALYALDPNLLAHASLVTNDVAFCLPVAGLTYFLWRAGERVTWGRAAMVALLCGLAVVTKFTGILMIPVVGLTLVIRALLPAEWQLANWPLKDRLRRLSAALALCAATGLVTFFVIWAVYGFRSRTAHDPAIHANFRQMMAESAVGEIRQREGRDPTPQELGLWRPSATVQACVFALKHHLLPDAFVSGFWLAYSKSLWRPSYLMGEIYGNGRWYYFPVAAAVKMPIATLAAVVGALAGMMLWKPARLTRWPAVCIAATAGVLGIMMMRSSMNIGIRHFLPVYVFGLLIAGVALGKWFERSRPAMARWGVGLVLLALAVESFAAFPDYIPFFNKIVGSPQAGIAVLGDSNVDWGQDLPVLAQWQQRNPNRTLHLAYFGTADPVYYGIRANLLTGEAGVAFRDRTLPTAGVLAVSATVLQGIPQWPAANPFAPLLRRQPTQVLGGSIYVYDLDAEGPNH